MTNKIDTSPARLRALADWVDESYGLITPAKMLRALADEKEAIGKALHYPECWDTAAYPTVVEALQEVVHSVKCSDPSHEAEKEALPLECPTCGSDCNERDMLEKAEREIEKLRAEKEAAPLPAHEYYVSGPMFADGAMAVCELATGRIVHKFFIGEQTTEGVSLPEPTLGDRASKVTGAPNYIWLVYGDLEHDETHENCYRDGEVTWCQDPQYGSDIRYVRADLFKAIATHPKPAPMLLTDEEIDDLFIGCASEDDIWKTRAIEAAVLKKNGDAMNEKILKNEADFLKWKDDELLFDQEAKTPAKYPCIAGTNITDWRPPTLGAVYKYREDIAAILAELDAVIAEKKNGIGA